MIRNKISGPVELISTTNMLSYNAPDIYPASVSPNSSGDESDIPSLSHSTSTTPDSSVRGSTPITPEPNHLSSYFAASGKQSTPSSEDIPKIPQRALSHTKKSHEILSAKRSVRHAPTSSYASSTPRKTSVSSVSRASIDMFSPNTDAFDSNPFGNELAQVRELAEEYGVQDKMMIIDEEEQELLSRGLCKFSAEDYMSEIYGLYSDMIGISQPVTALWI